MAKNSGQNFRNLQGGSILLIHRLHPEVHAYGKELSTMPTKLIE